MNPGNVPPSPPPSAAAVHGARGPELTAAQLHDLLRLRVDVFVVEQACPYHEIDGLDLADDTRHLWTADERGPTAALRILTEDAGRRIGRVVTRSDCRGAGLAGRLLTAALEEVGHLPTVLAAQSHLRRFYERFGYRVVGPEFIEDGIPHLPMSRPPE